MELFPAIDLRGGQVVRLHQGDYDQQTTYHDDPVAQAQRFAAAGANWVHIVDLDGAREGRMSHLDVIRRVCEEVQINVEVGGGVRTEGVIDQLVSIGVKRIVLGTAALSNWSWFNGLMGNPSYRGKLVLGLDARGGKVAVSGWEQQLEQTPLELAEQVNDWPLASIVYTDIAFDGTMKGPNLMATKELAAVTRIPVVASGGVGTLDHLRALKGLDIEGVIVGKALYENVFTVEEAVGVLSE